MSEDIVTRLETEALLCSPDKEFFRLLREAAATIAALRAEAKLCGKDNCMGRKVDGVTQWMTVDAHEAAMAALRAEVERLERDAERWRWLSSDCDADPQCDFIIWLNGHVGSQDEINAEVDAAIAQTKERA